MTEEQKEFEDFQKFKEMKKKAMKPDGRVEKKHPVGDYLAKVWGKYWKYLAWAGLIFFISTKFLFPWLRSLLPGKNFFDETDIISQVVFTLILNFLAFGWGVFGSWLGFRTADDFMSEESDTQGWKYAFNNLRTKDGKLDQVRLWKVVICLVIFCFFYYMFLYGASLPK